MKVTYTEESNRRYRRGDHLHQRTQSNRRAKLDEEITRCIERLAAREFDGPVSRLRSGAVVRNWGVPPFRIYYQRHPDELLIVRVWRAHPSRDKPYCLADGVLRTRGTDEVS